jgi:predicted nucleotidyltransferase
MYFHILHNLMGEIDMNETEDVCEIAVEKALEETMSKCGVRDKRLVIDLLKSGEPCHQGYFRFYLVRHVMDCIVSRLKDLRCIYIFGSTTFDAAGLMSDINIIVHVGKRDKAHTKLMDEVNMMLTNEYRTLLGFECKECFRLLDVHIVTDKDVKAGNGVARLLSSFHDPPIPMWRRGEGLCGLDAKGRDTR